MTEIPVGNPDHWLAPEAFADVWQQVATSAGVRPSELSHEQFTTEYGRTGFAEWDPEMAGVAARAIAAMLVAERMH